MRPVFLLLALAFPLFAQSPVMETIEVRVANVDAVVTDKNGKPFTGLTRDDFELYEDGKRQTITNFSEIRETAEPASAAAAPAEAAVPSRARRFLLFVDVSSIHPQMRDTIVVSLRKFVDTQLQPADQASVVVWNEQIHVLSNLTSDKAQLAAALAKAKALSSPNTLRSEINQIQQYCSNMLSMARSGRLPMQSAYLDCINTARAEVQATVNMSRRLLNALGITLAMTGGGDAKKVLVVASAQLPRRPGLETFQWANALFSPFLRGFNAPQEQFQEEHSMPDAIRDFARNANASGVSVYLVNAPGVANPMSPANANGVADEGADFRYAANTSDAFDEIARATGGVAARTRSNFDALLTTVSQDLGAYYSLGYRPAERSRSPRRIEVRTRDRALTVRARQTWMDRTSDDQMNDRVIANVFNPAPPGDFTVRLRAGKPTGEGATKKVPIEIVFPSSAITLLPSAGNNLDGGFTVWITVGDRRGALSPVSRSPQPIRVAVAEERAFRAEPIGFTAELTVSKGENIVSVAIVDKASGTAAFASVTVIAE